MKILAAAFASDTRLADDSIYTSRGFCAEPHIRPIAGHFTGTIMRYDDCLEDMQKVYDIMKGKGEKRIIGPGAGNATYLLYSRDLVILGDDFPGGYPCIMHPEQYLCFSASLYNLLTTGEPTLFEVDLLSHTTYPEEYPILEHIKSFTIDFAFGRYSTAYQT